MRHLAVIVALGLAAVALAQEPEAVVEVAPDPRLAALDALAGVRGQAWSSAPDPGMRRVGGNGPGRLQYELPSEPPSLGRFRAEAIHYEYVDHRLATVIAAIRHPFDAAGVLRDLEQAYGPPTWQDESTRIWRGAQVRLVHRQQAADLWIVTWSWLPLHASP